MFASSAPAAIDGLVDLFTTAGLTVYDGPEVVGDVDTEWLVVGYSDGEQPAVDASLDFGNMTFAAQTEDYTVRCCLAAVQGDPDSEGTVTLASVRATAFGMLATVGQALAANHTLGGAVLVARLSEWAYTPVQSAAGTQSVIEFSVAVTAQTL